MNLRELHSPDATIPQYCSSVGFGVSCHDIAYISSANHMGNANCATALGPVAYHCDPLDIHILSHFPFLLS